MRRGRWGSDRGGRPVLLCTAGTAPAAPTTEEVSLTDDERRGDNAIGSRGGAVSAGGRYVASESTARLARGDANAFKDVYVRDRVAGTTHLVSVSSAGAGANGISFGADISGDGRSLAFTSARDNLVPGDTNGAFDVVVHDRATATTARASVGSHGQQGDDGHFPGDGLATAPAISAGGRFVAFTSPWSGFASGDSDAGRDVVVRDLRLGTADLESVPTSAAQVLNVAARPSLGADGRYLAWDDFAVLAAPDGGGRLRRVRARPVPRHDPDRHGHRLGTDGEGRDAAVSGEGRCVAFTSLQRRMPAMRTTRSTSSSATSRRAPSSG